MTARVSASGSWTVGTTNTCTVTLPSHASGDLLIVELHSSTDDTTVPTHPTTISGWTKVSGEASNSSGGRRCKVSIWAKEATSGAETYSTGATLAPTGTSAAQHAGRGHTIAAGSWNDTGTLTDAFEDFTAASSADSSTLAFSGFSSTTDDVLAFASVRQADDVATGVTNDGSYVTVGADSDSGTGTDGYSHTAAKTLVAAGSGDATFTFTSGGSISTAGFLFGIAAGPGRQRTVTEGAKASDSISHVKYPLDVTVDSTNWNTATGLTVNTPSSATLSVPAGSVVLAFVTIYNTGTYPTGSTVSTVSATGGTLSWSQVGTTIGEDDGVNVEVWQGTPSAALTSVQVRATADSTTEGMGLGVAVFTNADTTLGDTSSATGSTGTPAVTVNAGASDAVVFAVFAYYNSVTPTAGTGDTVLNYANPAGSTIWWMRATGLVTGDTEVSITNTATAGWCAIGVEVKPTSGGSLSGTTTENATSSDQIGVVRYTPALTATDDAVASDSTLPGVGVSGQVTNAAYANDAEEPAVAKASASTDSIYANDAGTPAVAKAVESADGAYASDSELPGVGVSGQVTDAVYAQDEGQIAAVASCSSTDDVASSDPTDFTLDTGDEAFEHTVTEAVYASDAEAPAVEKSVQITDAVYANDAEAPAVGKSGQITDAAYANDAEAPAVGKSGQVTDAAYASDAEAPAVGKSGQTTDAAYANDAEAPAVGKAGQITDAAYANDAESAAYEVSSSATDSAQANDDEDVVIVAGGEVAVSISEALFAQDAVDERYAVSATATDAAFSADLLAVAVAAATSFADAVQASDAAALEVVASVAQSEGAFAIDDVAAMLSADSIGLDVTDAALVSDLMSADTGVVARDVMDRAAATDAVTCAVKTAFGQFNVWNGSTWVAWNGSTWV